MDNNNSNNNTPNSDLSLDPSLLAPQGVSPTAAPSSTSHLIDITPGVQEPTPTPVSPITPVQTSPLPDNKVIDITPSSLNDFAPIPPVAEVTTPVLPPTPDPTPATPVSTPIMSAPSEPLAPVMPVIQPTPTPSASPLQEDPNLVKTIS